MQANERMSLLIEQVQELVALVNGLSECKTPVPPSLLKMAQNKCDRIAVQLASLETPLTTPTPIQAAITTKTTTIEASPKAPKQEAQTTTAIPTTEPIPIAEKQAEPTPCEPIPIKTILADTFGGQTLMNQFEDRFSSTVQGSLHVHSGGNLNQIISLNDRFRFRKEFFASNQEKMIVAFNEISDMNSLEEVERYICKKSGLPADHETILYFLALLESRFQ